MRHIQCFSAQRAEHNAGTQGLGARHQGFQPSRRGNFVILEKGNIAPRCRRPPGIARIGDAGARFMDIADGTPCDCAGIGDTIAGGSIRIIVNDDDFVRLAALCHQTGQRVAQTFRAAKGGQDNRDAHADASI